MLFRSEARARGESTDSFKTAALGAYANMLTHLHYWMAASGDQYYDQYAARVALVKEQAAAFENPGAAYAAAAARWGLGELADEAADDALALLFFFVVGGKVQRGRNVMI